MTTASSDRITEPLVDAKDEARQTELRSEFAQALLTLHKHNTALTWRTITVIIAGFGISVAIILNSLPGG